MTTEEIKFEKALERLETIVEELEAGNIPLEEALKKYEEGIRLSAACQKKLAQAEKKIEILTRTLDGSLKKEPFDLEDTASEDGVHPKPRKKSGRAGAKAESENAGGDGDLLF